MATLPEPAQFRGDERSSSERSSTAELSGPDELSQVGLDLLGAGDAMGSALAFRKAIAAGSMQDMDHVEAYHGLVRALCDAEQFEEAVTAALALTALTPDDPLAHTSLSIALQKAGRIPEAEAAAGRARILEWKQLLAEPAEG